MIDSDPRSTSSEDDLAQRRFALMAEQVASLRVSFMLMLGAKTAIIAQAAPWPLVLAWSAQALLIFAMRLRWLQRHTDAPAQTVRSRITKAVAWNVALGLSIGSSSFFMIWLDTSWACVLTTIMVSTAAGAVAISGPLLPVYLGYTAGIMLPLAVGWLIQGTTLGHVFVLLMGSFVIVQYRFARRVSDTFTESFMIRQQNEALLHQVMKAHEQADAANRAKTRFLAAASHDLRQPLHALSLQSAALLLDPRGQETPVIAEAIAKSVEDVGSLLDSLLDISKLDAGVLTANKRAIQLSRLVDNVARSVRPWVESKGLAFELHNLPGQVVESDPILLERILRNLIDNAIKFTEVGGIQMRLTRHDEQLTLAVTDTGIGIDIDAQSKVFDEFYQIDRHAGGHTRGLGLGLSIVSRLAQLLDLQVSLESELGRGTTILLHLPVTTGVATPPASPPRTKEVSVALNGLRVLVIDDEPSICAGMAMLLKRLECEVACADSLEKAEATLADFAPQVLLIDYRLKADVNGIAAARQLQDKVAGLGAVLISGDTAPDRLREANESGLALLHKPVSLDQLRRALALHAVSVS